jgi:hypothetical protein
MVEESLAAKLLMEIARCPIVQHCIRNPDTNHPCAQIVRSQNAVTFDDHQVPEPWTGHLASAPILFFGSNPSISILEQYPRWSSPDDLIEDFFDNRFGGGQKEWIKDGRFSLGQDGTHSKEWVRFWAAVRQRAAELLVKPASDVRPGIDYAMSEVVHCKSRKEIGVRDAFDTCVNRYLRRVVEESGAKVIVGLGNYAAAAITHTFNIPNGADVFGPVDAGGSERTFAFLPHPNAHKIRSFAGCFTNVQIEALQALLK